MATSLCALSYMEWLFEGLNNGVEVVSCVLAAWGESTAA